MTNGGRFKIRNALFGRRYKMNYLSLMLVFLTSLTQSNRNLTAEQIVLLMKASAEQYQTIDAKLAYEAYRRIEPNEELKQSVKSNIILRWSREKVFAKFDRTAYSDSIPPSRSFYTYSINSLRSKKLVEELNGSANRAFIAPGKELEGDIPAVGIYDAMWEGVIHCFVFWKDNFDMLELEFIPDKEVYILSSPAGGTTTGKRLLKFYIDPKKDYIPISQVFLKPDLSIGKVRDLNDLRKTKNGFWIPYKYSDTYVNFKGIYTVEEVKVNEQIPDSLFDFEFPEGTIVTDNRIGAKYRVTKQAGQTVTSVPTEPNTVIKLPQPATDEKLRSIAGKASELAAAAAAEKQALKIEVFPQYVYVKPDKTQYSLTIKKTGDTKPQLLDYTFESDKMKLTSVDNKISEKQQFIVNIQRKQEDKGFQKAVLSLRFADEKIDVIFVSPPLENI
jgi:hypothetical protein